MTAETTIWLVRHGQTDWNLEGRFHGHRDIPLNSIGVAQAERIGKWFADKPLRAVWSSDLSRARETANQIARHHGLEVSLCSMLRETNFGSWEGLTWQDIEADFPEFWQNWLDDPTSNPAPGGETVSQLSLRFAKAVKDIAHRYPGETIAIGTHGGPIASLVSTSLKVPFREGLVVNGGIVRLKYQGQNFEFGAIVELKNL